MESFKHEIVDGGGYYYINSFGEHHREDGPALEFANSGKYWYNRGLLHREGGPAIERINGEKYWYLNGQRHREDGPAVECFHGYKAWYLNGLRHREDGPAIEYSNGHKEYWLHGEKVLTAEERIQQEKRKQNARSLQLENESKLI